MTPYWGLRKYDGAQDLVWGGDAGHEHEWRGLRAPWATAVLGPSKNHPKNRVDDSQNVGKESGAFCLCGGWRGAIGAEPTPWLYVEHMVEIMREVWRVLRDDGCVFLNLGDTFYSGPDGGSNTGRGGRGQRGIGHGPKNGVVAEHLAPRRRESLGTNRGVHLASQAGKQGKRIVADGPHAQPNREPQQGIRPKSRLLIPHRVAIALEEDGWIVRMDNVWAKKNAMPDSTDDRTTPAHEYLFHLVKSGEATFWTHRSRAGVRRKPRPDHRWQEYALVDGMAVPVGEERREAPADWQAALLDDGTTRRWRRVNLWAGHDYFYDQDAIREPLAESSLVRIRQENVGRQGGAKDYANGTNPTRSARGTIKRFRDKTLDTPHAGGANKRSVWTVATTPYPGSHFAVMPEALVEPCVLAGSAPQACGVCGAPWARVSEATGHINRREPAHVPGNAATKSDSTGWQPTRQSTDRWLPTCEHDDASGSCVVLDPFAGSGTVVRVAQRLGRSGVGLDLSRKYLSEQALARVDPLAAARVDVAAGRSTQAVLEL